MDNSPQQQENHTNTLSEHHVQGAIETVLTSRVQSYEEFMDSFVVLTPDDVANFSARSVGTENDHINLPLSGDGNPAGLFDASSTAIGSSQEFPGADGGHGNQKQEEELEVEVLGDDMVKGEEIGASMETQRSSKYIQVDNYLDDEPDSESEFLSENDEELEFDDSSSKYVASFDTEKSEDGGAAKSTAPVTVTPEMIQRAADESDVDESMDESNVAGASPPFPGPYPGEVDDNQEGDVAAPQSGAMPGNHHVTQLPHSTKPPLPSDIPALAQAKEEEIVSEEAHDEVEPFSIDPDFDYDNVILTPKWSPGEGPPFRP